jgi:hypothetical protein
LAIFNAKLNDCLLHDFEKVQENLGDHEQAQSLRFRVLNGDNNKSILQFKLVRNPAEEFFMSCTNIVFAVALKKIKAEPSEHPSAYEFEQGCAILHPQYKLSSTVSCLQKIRILRNYSYFLGAAANSEMF